MKWNEQPISKPVEDPEGNLRVFHLFKTLQGEGPFVGVPSIFIRLWGCNLQCPQCDTDYSSRDALYAPDQLIRAVGDLRPAHRPPEKSLVVLTGGEPFRQPIGPFVRMALEAGYRVQLETNGTLMRTLPFDSPDLFVVCSPKTGRIHPELLPHIHAFKYVVTAGEVSPVDGLPTRALGHGSRHDLVRPPTRFAGPIYVQPADVQDPVQNRRNLEAAVRSALEGGYTLGLQTHKVVGLD